MTLSSGRRPIYVDAHRKCYQIPAALVEALDKDAERIPGQNANQKIVNLLIDALGIDPSAVLTEHARIR